MKIVVGSYAAPSRPIEGRAEFELLTGGILGLPGVDGLEVPYIGADSPWQDAAHLGRVGGEHVLTTIPAMMSGLRRDPAFGLASVDADSRAAALRLLGDARTFVNKVNDGGGAVFDTVHLHSAPGRKRATAEAFARSIDEVASWNWSGAALAIEHCDALVPEHEHVKGFLALPEELTIAAEHGLGVVVNWGRSAIETRGVDGPVEHITAAAAQRVLTGLGFSGCAATAGAYGGPWEDTHLPFRAWGEGPLSDAAAASILTRAEIERCLIAAAEAPDLRYLGVKVASPAGSEPEEWLRVVDGHLTMLRSARRAVGLA